MHERHRRRAIEQLMRPVERRVATADDHDAPPAKFLGVRHDLVHATAVPRRGTRLRQATRRERADSARDHHCARRKPLPLGRQHEMTVLLRQPDDALAEMRLRAELPRLHGQLIHEILREHLRETRRRRRSTSPDIAP